MHCASPATLRGYFHYHRFPVGTGAEGRSGWALDKQLEGGEAWAPSSPATVTASIVHGHLPPPLPQLAGWLACWEQAWGGEFTP